MTQKLLDQEAAAIKRMLDEFFKVLPRFNFKKEWPPYFGEFCQFENEKKNKREQSKGYKNNG